MLTHKNDYKKECLYIDTKTNDEVTDNEEISNAVKDNIINDLDGYNND